MSFKEIFKRVISWRLITILMAIPAIFLITPRDRYVSISNGFSFHNLFSMWSNFDGTKYLRLAQYGYGYEHKSDSEYFLFPVYPLLVRFLGFLNNYLASGLIVSHLSLLLALYYLYKLITLDFKSKVAKSTLLLIAIFPTSFFLGSVYPESTQLLFIVLSFYLYRKKQYLLGSLTALIASATSSLGLFLWPSLIYEYWLGNDRNIRNCLKWRTLSLLLPPLGLILFLKFQYLYLGDYNVFTILKNTFIGDAVDKLILPHQVFFRYLKMLVFSNRWDPLYFAVLLELFSAFLVLFMLTFSIKKVRFSYWFFVLLSFLIPSFSGTFISLPRTSIVLFPVFIYLSLFLDRQHPFLKVLYYLISLISLAVGISFFTRGYFIG